MQVRFIMSPVHAPEVLFDISRAMTLVELVEEVQAPQWFYDYGFIRIGGEAIPREIWSLVRLKPEALGFCDLCVTPRNKNILPLLATVAAVALASSVLGPASLGLLGSSFAAGGTGTYLAAAAIGVGGQLLASALTAPPSGGASGRNTDRSVAQAGIGVNPAALFEPLPVVFGKIHASPPLIMPGFTELIDGELWLNAAVGVEGRCLIENIKINGIKSADVARAQIETREGNVGETMPGVGSKLVVQKVLNSQTISNFRTVDNDTVNDQLVDQVTPDNSMPGWHVVETAGNWTEFDIRILMPGGAINTVSGDDAMVPIRLEGKLKSSSTWRKFPTIHAQDVKSGTGEVRFEIKLKRSPYPAGVHYSYSGTQWPVLDLCNITGVGQAFQYTSDPYFQSVAYNTPTLLPDFTSATSGIYTLSASSEFNSSSQAWRVGDQATGLYWRAADNSLPATLTLSCSTPQVFRSYLMNFDSALLGSAPMAWQVHGFNGTAWILLHDMNRVGEDPLVQQNFVFNLANHAAYQQYRWTITAVNGAPSDQLRVLELMMYAHPSQGFVLETEPGGGINIGNAARLSVTGFCRATNCEVTPDGCTFFLDPDSWPFGEYEFRLKRGVAVDTAFFKPFQYNYNANSANADFFERRLVSGKHVVRVGQKRYRSDTVIESITTIDDTMAAYNHAGLALITLRVPGLVVDSLSADFTSYGNEWNGTAWTSTQVPTQNPAALYRNVLRGYSNAKPVADEIIDNDALVVWFNRCVANGRKCNAIVSGQSIEPTLQMLASTGWAAPRHSNSEGVVEDYDTSAQPIELMLMPINSRDLGEAIVWPDEVHCIIAEYNDELDDYKLKQKYIYKAGYSAANATLFETWSLPGFTSEAAATERATFDILQSELRASRYSFEIGMEAYKLRRGSVVGVTSDVIDRKQSFGIIEGIATLGGNVVSITLDNLVPWSELLVGDVRGVAIQLADGVTTLVKTVTEMTDSYTCTFTTPFADTGVVVQGLLVATGVAGKEFKRCKVMNITSQDIDVRKLELADEAPLLFS